MRGFDRITDSVDMSLRKLWEIVEEKGAWHSIVSGEAEWELQIKEQHRIIKYYMF